MIFPPERVRVYSQNKGTPRVGGLFRGRPGAHKDLAEACQDWVWLPASALSTSAFMIVWQ